MSETGRGAFFRRAGIVLLLLLSLILVYRATRKETGSLGRNRDFATEVWTGRFPYEKPIHAPYPPSYGFLMGVLLPFPVLPARILWACLQLCCLVLLWRHLRGWWASLARGRSPPLWIPLLVLVLGSRYLLRDMAGGGGNLVFGTFVCLACLRPGEAPGEDRKPLRGLLLGLVLAAKPTPVLFLPWLWIRGRRKTLGLALLTAFLLHLAPVTTLGPSGWARAYTHWAEGAMAYAAEPDLFAAPSHDFPPFSWMHQSLRHALARFLGTVPPSRLSELPDLLAFRGAGFDPPPVAGIFRMSALLLLTASFLRLWKRRRDGSPWVELSALGLLFTLTLLLSPITWKAHHVQLLPVFFLLLARMARMARMEGREGGRLWIGLLLYFLFCVLLSQEVIGKRGKEGMQSLYVVTFGALWLWTECLGILSPSSSGDRAPSDRPPGAP